MVPSEIFKHTVTVFISILTAVATTFLINYMKDKKRKMVEQKTFYDDRIMIINSIVLISLLSFVLATIINSVDLSNNYKLPFIILIGLMVVFFTYAHLRLHKSFLIDTFHNKETKCSLVLISIFILMIWISTLLVIFFIESFGDKPTHIAYLLILFFYTMLFNLKQYFKWNVTRSYKKIVVATIDGDRYESLELMSLDDYIVIYESKSDKRVIIPYHQIKVIEYEYAKTTLAGFMDKEH